MVNGVVVRGFVLDTCTIINIIQNRAVADLLKCHLDMEKCPVYLNEVSLQEASRKGYSSKAVIQDVQNRLNTIVVVKKVSEEMHYKAAKMEKDCSLIHHGDSAIVSFSLKHNSTLITYDKDLLNGCKMMGISAISPNMLIEGAFA